MHGSCAQLDSPIGRLWVTVSQRGLLSIARGDLPPSGAELDPAGVADVVAELRGYFSHQRSSFSVELDLTEATAFDVAVWKAAVAIPYGRTASYGEVAVMAGHPGAARAVGGSMARCPLAPVVPCHRVIHADGSIGGWGSDTWVKRWLLAHEASLVT